MSRLTCTSGADLLRPPAAGPRNLPVARRQFLQPLVPLAARGRNPDHRGCRRAVAADQPGDAGPGSQRRVQRRGTRRAGGRDLLPDGG